MGWFTVSLRRIFHLCQLGGAAAACAIYASNYDGLTKDYRWNFAITTSAFTIAGTIIQTVFIGYFPDEFDDGWIILSGFCSGILFLFWTGVLGTFARSFIHRDPNYSHGIRMMQVAVYIDAANMVIWFLTVAYMIGMLVQYEKSTATPRRRNTEELSQLRRPSSTTFVPYGWDTVDIEAQTSNGSVETENPPPPTTIDMYEAHPDIFDPVPPVPHLPRHTATDDRYVTRLRDMAGTGSVPEALHMLSNELQQYPPIPPPMRSPDTSTLHSLIRESQPYSASPRLSSQYRPSTYRPLRHSTYDQEANTAGRFNTYAAFPFPISRQASLSKWSWPRSLEPEPTKECPICIEEHPCWTGFPSRIAGACKSHEQDACRDCIAKTIAAEIDNNISGQIHCYKCRALLEYDEVKALASPTTFERYETMGLRSFVSNNPNFVWCQSPHCEAGQEHVGGVDQPIVTCQACGFKTCFKHQIPWHENMLCDEYDERLPLTDNDQRLRAQQEAASIAAVHEVTKPCANKKCRAPIQKNMGCDHMTCRACKHEFCWVCGANWGGVHLSGCGHR